jgi:hypothetical protein
MNAPGWITRPKGPRLRKGSRYFTGGIIVLPHAHFYMRSVSPRGAVVLRGEPDLLKAWFSVLVLDRSIMELTRLHFDFNYAMMLCCLFYAGKLPISPVPSLGHMAGLGLRDDALLSFYTGKVPISPVISFRRDQDPVLRLFRTRGNCVYKELPTRRFCLRRFFTRCYACFMPENVILYACFKILIGLAHLIFSYFCPSYI